MLADDPRVDAARVHAALLGEQLGEAERVQRRARSHHRHRLVGPSAGEVLGEHVERTADDDGDARQAAALDRFRGCGHDVEVALQHVEARLAALRVRADGDHHHVFALDLLEGAATNIGAREQRHRVEVVERLTSRALTSAAVERETPGQSLEDDRTRGRDTDAAGADDSDSQSRHLPSLITLRSTTGGRVACARNRGH